jgi:hypothetical protein
MEEARSERTETEESSGGEVDRNAGEVRDDPRREPRAGWPKGELDQRPEDAVRAARREVSTGTN